jgi:hypothetical protein
MVLAYRERETEANLDLISTQAELVVAKIEAEMHWVRVGCRIIADRQPGWRLASRRFQLGFCGDADAAGLGARRCRSVDML